MCKLAMRKFKEESKIIETVLQVGVNPRDSSLSLRSL